MNTVQRTKKNDLVVLLATGFLSGFLPLFPGTWGTFAGIPLVMLVHLAGPVLQPLFIVLFFLASVWVSGRAEVLLGHRDAGAIVIDEICGLLVALAWLPIGFFSVCLGFLLFRLFDVVKPPPIGRLESGLAGGWAVVLDDVLAGVYTNISLRILLSFLDIG